MPVILLLGSRSERTLARHGFPNFHADSRMAKHPIDRHPYDRDPGSRPIAKDLPDGVYVYVRDIDGTIYVLPDGSHLHPRVLGGAKPAEYAGDLTVRGGKIRDVTNLSGTFQFDDPIGLIAVAEALEQMGLELLPDAIRFFPVDGSEPRVLR
jgi:hypothetical protein